MREQIDPGSKSYRRTNTQGANRRPGNSLVPGAGANAPQIGSPREKVLGFGWGMGGGREGVWWSSLPSPPLGFSLSPWCYSSCLSPCSPSCSVFTCARNRCLFLRRFGASLLPSRGPPFSPVGLSLPGCLWVRKSPEALYCPEAAIYSAVLFYLLLMPPPCSFDTWPTCPPTAARLPPSPAGPSCRAGSRTLDASPSLPRTGGSSPTP